VVVVVLVVAVVVKAVVVVMVVAVMVLVVVVTVGSKNCHINNQNCNKLLFTLYLYVTESRKMKLMRHEIRVGGNESFGAAQSNFLQTITIRLPSNHLFTSTSAHTRP